MWWVVAFRRSPEGEAQSTFVDMPDTLTTEAEVWDALERGDVPDNYFPRGQIISVDPAQGNSPNWMPAT